MTAVVLCQPAQPQACEAGAGSSGNTDSAAGGFTALLAEALATFGEVATIGQPTSAVGLEDNPEPQEDVSQSDGVLQGLTVALVPVGLQVPEPLQVDTDVTRSAEDVPQAGPAGRQATIGTEAAVAPVQLLSETPDVGEALPAGLRVHAREVASRGDSVAVGGDAQPWPKEMPSGQGRQIVSESEDTRLPRAQTTPLPKAEEPVKAAVPVGGDEPANTSTDAQPLRLAGTPAPHAAARESPDAGSRRAMAENAGSEGSSTRSTNHDAAPVEEAVLRDTAGALPKDVVTNVAGPVPVTDHVSRMDQPISVQQVGAVALGERTSVPTDAQPTVEAGSQADRQADLPHRVIDQVVREAVLRRLPDRNDLVVRLNPPELGAVRLRIVQDAQGITSHIQASTEQVRGLLQAHVPMLVDALADAGVRLGAVSVTSDSSFPAFEQGWAEGGQHQKHGGHSNNAGNTHSGLGADAAQAAILTVSAGETGVSYSWLA